MSQPLRFRAKIELFETRAGGPEYFSFPESGMRAVPTDFPGVPGLNTVVMHSECNLRVQNGTAFEADCRVLEEELFAGKVRPGTEFHIWDGRYIARGRVLEVFHEN